MVDTNIFNRICDGHIPAAILAGKELFATGVQYREILDTASDERRARLLATFKLLAPTIHGTRTSLWDDSRFDSDRWSEEDGLYERMLARLVDLDKNAKRKRPLNQSGDVRIAETSIKDNFVLITNDTNLTTLTTEFGGQVWHP